VKTRYRDRIARLIFHEYREQYSRDYDDEFGYQEHTVNARLSADAIQNSFFLIPRPKFLQRGRYGLK
jgi:hypothetical protein